MIDFIPEAQTLLIVVQGVEIGKPNYKHKKGQIRYIDTVKQENENCLYSTLSLSLLSIVGLKVKSHCKPKWPTWPLS